MADHVHLCLSISPKYSVANTVGILEEKSAMRLHREYLGEKRNFTGLHFWARGYCESTIGLDEKVIRGYPMQIEKKARPISQTEHTIFISEDGPVILTERP